MIKKLLLLSAVACVFLSASQANSNAEATLAKVARALGVPEEERAILDAIEIAKKKADAYEIIYNQRYEMFNRKPDVRDGSEQEQYYKEKLFKVFEEAKVPAFAQEIILSALVEDKDLQNIMRDLRRQWAGASDDLADEILFAAGLM